MNKLELHHHFVLLGRQRHQITYELLAILPEIYSRKIYIDHGFATIYEYAGKFAGLSHSVVKKTLCTEKYLQKKPHLKAAVATHGIHKVALVASLASPSTDAAYADKVKNMSKPALQLLSKELRAKIYPTVPRLITRRVEMDPEMEFLFLKVKKKLGGHLSDKEALKRMLKKFVEEPKPTTPKEKLIPGDESKCSRYIPIAKQRAVLSRSDGKCEFPDCNKPYDVFHHPERFSIVKNHKLIVALCNEHHEYPHNGLIQNEQIDPRRWKIQLTEKPKLNIDRKYRSFRQMAMAP